MKDENPRDDAGSSAPSAGGATAEVTVGSLMEERRRYELWLGRAERAPGRDAEARVRARARRLHDPPGAGRGEAGGPGGWPARGADDADDAHRVARGAAAPRARRARRGGAAGARGRDERRGVGGRREEGGRPASPISSASTPRPPMRSSGRASSSPTPSVRRRRTSRSSPSPRPRRRMARLQPLRRRRRLRRPWSARTPRVDVPEVPPRGTTNVPVQPGGRGAAAASAARSRGRPARRAPRTGTGASDAAEPAPPRCRGRQRPHRRSFRRARVPQLRGGRERSARPASPPARAEQPATAAGEREAGGASRAAAEPQPVRAEGAGEDHQQRRRRRPPARVAPRGRVGQPRRATSAAISRSCCATSPPKGAKTLKCGECGAMNYPTEWYCERCGAELASL